MSTRGGDGAVQAGGAAPTRARRRAARPGERGGEGAEGRGGGVGEGGERGGGDAVRGRGSAGREGQSGKVAEWQSGGRDRTPACEVAARCTRGCLRTSRGRGRRWSETGTDRTERTNGTDARRLRCAARGGAPCRGARACGRCGGWWWRRGAFRWGTPRLRGLRRGRSGRVARWRGGGRARRR